MLNIDTVREDSIIQLCERLREHGIDIWSSSESLPEEVMQQFVSLDKEAQVDEPRAEEILGAGVIHELPKDALRIDLRHFVDGSPKTVNVGFLLGNRGIFCPVALSHVGAAAVAFDFDKRRWRETGFLEKYLILVSTDVAMGIGVSVTGKWKLEDPLSHQKENPPSQKDKRQVNLTDTAEMRAAAVRRARRRMKNCEKELVQTLSERYSEEWIAVDGTLFDIEGYSEGTLFDIEKEIRVVGISKSFTLDPIVRKGGKQENIGYLGGLLRNLEVGHRSPVYELTPDKNHRDRYTYMWFIRIHPARQSPVSGIVKVELPPSKCYLDDREELRKTVDGLSHAIFRMRTPYLYDNRRGESFLYPIYVAETLVKSKLSSVEKLRGIWAYNLRRAGGR
jgi:hypothetical protein